MKTKIIILVSSMALIGVFGFSYFRSINSKETKIECLFMAYACGDCYPQYKVIKVEDLELRSRILDKDIAITFKDTSMAASFETKVGECGICYTYKFKGTMTYSAMKNEYTFRVTDYKLKENNPDCCNPK